MPDYLSRDEALKIARACAYAKSHTHSYLPKTKGEATTWQPHEWVLDAIRWCAPAEAALAAPRVEGGDSWRTEPSHDDWRVGWALAYCGWALYTDDGELQDNRDSPFIDFARDSAADIRQKIAERAAKHSRIIESAGSYGPLTATTPASASVPEGMVLIDKGAVKLVENVLRRNGKDEVADAMLSAIGNAMLAAAGGEGVGGG